MPLPYVSTSPRPRALDTDSELQFGIYRDGDNNLDTAQSAVLDQARDVSEQSPEIAFNIEDTTKRDDEAGPGGALRTEEYDYNHGETNNLDVEQAKDMSKRSVLANFVAHTLDEAENHHANSTWLDLVDHGGGDGGAFQTNSSGGGVMREDDIAGAIADGVRRHAMAHPEDAQRGVTGVIANACLMATLGMESALSHVGVKFLAASPETMLAPGTPSAVAQDILNNPNDPTAMAKAIVHRTMSERYNFGGGERFGPAAAFDVFDLDPTKIASMEKSVKTVNLALIAAAKNPQELAEIRSDAANIEGMTRSQEPGLPWHADRPAELLYKTLASDGQLDDAVRQAAQDARVAIKAGVLAHSESHDYAPFNDESYRDAVGPTVHFPTTKGEIDPWAPTMSETDTAFATATGEKAMARAIA